MSRIKKYNVIEGGSGVLTLIDVDSEIRKIYQPDCDLDSARKMLYEFYEMPTSAGSIVKNSFNIKGTDWFPSTVSQLYWHFFWQYVKYKPLIDKWKAGEIEFVHTSSGRFSTLLKYLKDSYKISAKLKIKLKLNRLLMLRNEKVVINEDSNILFLRSNLSDFRTTELLAQLKNNFSVIQLAHVSIQDIVRNWYNRNVVFAPYSVEGNSDIFSSVELNNCQYWLYVYALRYVKYVINSHLKSIECVKPFFDKHKFVAFVGLDDCNYPYPYIYAAQDLGIQCVGIQHGGYASRHEAYVMRNLTSHRWYNHLIVWGEYWRDLLLQNNKILQKDQIHIASNKHFYDYRFMEKKCHSPSILIPYEFLADTLSIGKYMIGFAKAGFKIYFKPRSDAQLVDQLDAYDIGDLKHKLKIVNKITPEIMAKIDVVAGTQTTLLYDLLPYEKPTWILETSFRLQEDMVQNGYARLISFADLIKINEIYKKDMESSMKIDAEMFSGSNSVVEVLQSMIGGFHN